MEALHLNERERLVIHEGGIIIGRANEKVAIARNMLAKGFDLETIAECTGLSEVEVLALK